MNLEKLNQWLSLLANVAVLVGILFLIIEISQNTEAIRIESETARFSVSEAAFGPAAYDRQVTEVLVSVGKHIEENGIGDLDFLYNTDHRQFQNIVNRRMALFQHRFFSYPEERDSLRRVIMNQLEQPGFYAIFDVHPFLRESGEFGDFVRETIDELERL